MSGIAPKPFPWPAAIGNSQGVQPLNQAQAPLQNTGTQPAQPSQTAQAPTTPTQPPTSPIVGQNPFQNQNPMPPISSPISIRALYGA